MSSFSYSLVCSWTASAAFALAGCSASAPAAAADAGAADARGASRDGDGAPLASGDVVATIDYRGGAQGHLMTGVFHEVPPAGPPVAFDVQTSPAFPATVALRAVEPGDWYVVTFLDVPPFVTGSPRPGPEDPQIASPRITVTAGGTARVSLVLPGGGDGDGGHEDAGGGAVDGGHEGGGDAG